MALLCLHSGGSKLNQRNEGHPERRISRPLHHPSIIFITSSSSLSPHIFPSSLTQELLCDLLRVALALKLLNKSLRSLWWIPLTFSGEQNHLVYPLNFSNPRWNGLRTKCVFRNLSSGCRDRKCCLCLE